MAEKVTLCQKQRKLNKDGSAFSHPEQFPKGPISKLLISELISLCRLAQLTHHFSFSRRFLGVLVALQRVELQGAKSVFSGAEPLRHAPV